VRKYTVVRTSDLGCIRSLAYAAGPLSMANAPIAHMLPKVKLSANLDGRIMIYKAHRCQEGSGSRLRSSETYEREEDRGHAKE
jgi:hypothetical protein